MGNPTDMQSHYIYKLGDMLGMFLQYSWQMMSRNNWDHCLKQHGMGINKTLRVIIMHNDAFILLPF